MRARLFDVCAHNLGPRPIKQCAQIKRSAGFSMNGRYRARTCDLTGVIRTLWPTELIARFAFSAEFNLITTPAAVKIASYVLAANRSRTA
jgi:hypothetical protein